MSTNNLHRDKILHIRLLESELLKIKDHFSNSTKRHLSEYIRSIILDKPITFYTRSKSIDEFVDAIVTLRRELNSIGDDFRLSVEKLQQYTEIPEINNWAVENEKNKNLFFLKLEEIENKIIEIDNKWLH